MTTQTGENEQGLRKIIDMTRMIAIAILVIHCYYTCYNAFKIWQLTSKLSDQLLLHISKTGLFSGFIKSKLIALIFLLLYQLGINSRKSFCCVLIYLNIYVSLSEKRFHLYFVQFVKEYRLL